MRFTKNVTRPIMMSVSYVKVLLLRNIVIVVGHVL